MDANDGVRLYYPLMRRTINPCEVNRQSGKSTRHAAARVFPSPYSFQLFAAFYSNVRYQSIRSTPRRESLLILSFDLTEFL